ncbi:MAG: ABC transporter permease [Chloroflexota bacterium]|nr:ABC transporter permease [Chloroflexota bacterium]
MRDEPLVRWDWVIDHLDQVGERLVEHLLLTGLAVGIGFAISFAVGLLAFRYRPVYAPVTGFAGVLYTIPSLALFGFLIPVTGLSLVTAEIALVSYTLLILIRNIVAGLDGVPDDVRDAAAGMGYGPMQSLLRVELPLALPVIIAGLRIATVTTIGLTTVTALITLGGLGRFIIDGISRNFPTASLLGAFLSIVLAVGADLAFLVLERAVTPWSRRGRPA